ncbi:MAG: hypothetical protein AAB473_03605 [Patescibacteria group bacterium]
MKYFLVGALCFIAFPKASLAITDESLDAKNEASASCVADSYHCSCTGASSVAGSSSSEATASAATCDTFCGKMDAQTYSLTCTDTSGRTNQPVSQGNVGDTIPTAGLADAVADTKADFLVPNLNVQIPGFSGFSTPTSSTSGGYVSVNFLAEYVSALYGWALAAGALVAVVMMMLGGLQYVMSRGKNTYIEKAKTRITNAITGLVLLLAAYNIAFLIDPNTTILKSLNVTDVAGIEADIAEQGGEEESDNITPNTLPINAVPISGDHIAYVGKSDDKFADADVVTALQNAANAFYAATNKDISVTDATRSLKTQATDFYNNCLKTGTCSPTTCNPTSKDVVTKSGSKYVLVGEYATLTDAENIISAMVEHATLSNCPHTSAVAIDAWGGPRAGDFKNDVALQQSLITAMIGAGFCRLSIEAWHFELEAKKVSKRSCTQSWNTTAYIDKNTGKLESRASSCKVWNFRKSYCAIPK